VVFVEVVELFVATAGVCYQLLLEQEAQWMLAKRLSRGQVLPTRPFDRFCEPLRILQVLVIDGPARERAAQWALDVRAARLSRGQVFNYLLPFPFTPMQALENLRGGQD
jgi:hypothetical protein